MLPLIVNLTGSFNQRRGRIDSEYGASAEDVEAVAPLLPLLVVMSDASGLIPRLEALVDGQFEVRFYPAAPAALT